MLQRTSFNPVLEMSRQLTTLAAVALQGNLPRVDQRAGERLRLGDREHMSIIRIPHGCAPLRSMELQEDKQGCGASAVNR